MPAASDQPARSILRSSAAILAGIVVVFILSMGTDAVFHATGIYPPWMQPMATHLWVIALAYRIPFGIISAWVVARLAPRRPMGHAILFGMIGVVMSALGVAATWNKGPEFGPLWFNLGLIAIALPCAWLGGKLCTSPFRPTPAPTVAY